MAKKANPFTFDPRYVLRHGTGQIPPLPSKAKRAELKEHGISRVQIYKGVRTWKEGDGWRVSMDPDSEFDTLKDAKRFIDAAQKRRLNPRSAFHEAYRKAQASPELRRKLQLTLGPGVMTDLEAKFKRHLETAKRLRWIKRETRKMRASA